MIKAIATKSDGTKLVIFGIDRGNVRRLQAGRPIFVQLWRMGLGKIEVSICYRDTMRQLTEELSEFVDLKTKIHFDPKAEEVFDGEREEKTKEEIADELERLSEHVKDPGSSLGVVPRQLRELAAKVRAL